MTARFRGWCSASGCEESPSRHINNRSRRTEHVLLVKVGEGCVGEGAVMGENHQSQRGTEVVDGEVTPAQLADLFFIVAENRCCTHPRASVGVTRMSCNNLLKRESFRRSRSISSSRNFGERSIERHGLGGGGDAGGGGAQGARC